MPIFSPLTVMALRALALAGVGQAALFPAQAQDGQRARDCDATVADGIPADCGLEAPPVYVLFDYEPAGSETPPVAALLSVTQSTAEGGQRDMTGPIDIVLPVSQPVLRDLDADDIEELFVPVEGGTVGTLFGLWQMDADGFYRQTGTIMMESVDAIRLEGALILTRLPGVSRVNSSFAIRTVQKKTELPLR